jgi:hypothetical protein
LWVLPPFSVPLQAKVRGEQADQESDEQRR